MEFEIKARDRKLTRRKTPPRLVFDAHIDTLERVRALAKENKISTAEFVRQCVRHCLAELDAKAGGESHG